MRDKNKCTTTKNSFRDIKKQIVYVINQKRLYTFDIS